MTSAAIARAFEVVLPLDVARTVGCSYRTVRDVRDMGRVPGGKVSQKVAGALAGASGVPLDEILAGDGSGRRPRRRTSARKGANAGPHPAGEATNVEEMDQFQALEKKRIEDAKIAALIREDKEMSLALRRGELIPAADVHARLGAGALAIRQGMEATRRAVLAAATKGSRKAVADALDGRCCMDQTIVASRPYP